jgi:ribonuclease T2
MQRFAPSLLRFCALTVALAAWCGCASAQNKGEPGKFDFYLMNLAWSPEFCNIQGVSPQCAATLAGRRGFTMHGLWAQNNDGSYPVFCSEEAGPATPADNLDVTPDLALLDHEWAKHGTCSAVGPQRFFTLERQALHALKIPRVLKQVDQEISMAPTAILTLFQSANPAFPPGSILLSCANDHLTAVEACFSKNLKPLVCQSLKSCAAASVKIAPPTAISH